VGIAVEVAVADTRFAVVWEEVASSEDGTNVVIVRSDRLIVNDANTTTLLHVGRALNPETLSKFAQRPPPEHTPPPSDAVLSLACALFRYLVRLPGAVGSGRPQSAVGTGAREGVRQGRRG
jgi:hypothetical protein